jgi:hypothetical protein
VATGSAAPTAGLVTEVSDALARFGLGGGALTRTASETADTPQFATERRNLLRVFTIALKALLEACADAHGEAVTDDTRQLDQFCIVLENVFRHGLKSTLHCITHCTRMALCVRQLDVPASLAFYMHVIARDALA